MIFAIIEGASGRLVSTTDEAGLVASAEQLQADGLECLTFENLTAWEAGGPWDAETRAFLPRDPPDEVLAQLAKGPDQ